MSLADLRWGALVFLSVVPLISSVRRHRQASLQGSTAYRLGIGLLIGGVAATVLRGVETQRNIERPPLRSATPDLWQRFSVRMPQRIDDCTGAWTRAIRAPNLYWEQGSRVPRVTYRNDSLSHWTGGLLGGITSWTLDVGQAARARSTKEHSQLTLCTETSRQAYLLLEGRDLVGTLAVSDTRTGAILAYATRGEPGASNRSPGVHDAITPGSVAKLWTTVLALTHGVDSKDFGCPARLRLGTAILHNAHGMALDRPTMSDAFAVSCNTYFAQLVLRLAQQIGSDSLRTLYEGIGVSFVGHSRASIQQPSRGVSIAAGVLSEHLRLPQFVMPALSDEWRLGQVAIGQGSWTMSPVAILPILGAIANNGLLVPITFEIAENRVAAQRIMPVAVAQTVAAMMQRVTSDGTGKLVANGAVAQRHGWRLIGKTGTAQRAVCAAEQQPAYRRYDHCAVVLTEDGLFGGIASSVDSSIAPLAIVAYVRDGGSGGGTAARLADAIASIAIDNRSAVRRVR